MIDRRALALFALIASPVLAQDDPTYDLRQRYTPQVGDRVQVEEQDRTRNGFQVVQQGRVVEEQNETVGAEQAHVEEVLRVDGDQVADSRRTYARFKDLATDEEHQVEGLVVTYTEDEAGSTTWAVAEGVEVPSALKAILDEDTGDSAEKASDERDKLMAAEPVRVGESWDIPLEFVAEQFGLEARDLVEEKSSARGTLTQVESAGGSEYRVIQLEIELATNKFQGMHCPEPLLFSLQVTIRISPTSPYGSSVLTGVVKGQAIPPDVPPGVVVELDTTIERRELRRPVE